MTVTEIQKALIARGYDLGPKGADGDAGPMTLTATAAFQKSIGLPGSGIPGERTLAALAKPVPDTLPISAPLDGPPLWLVLARAELGVHEGIGSANNPRVVKFYADAGFAGVREDSVAWCAAFVGAMLQRSGQKPSGSLAARSYETWGVGLKAPVLGCVVTKRRGNSSWQGHVFFAVGADASHVFGLGGNQGDGVSIASFKRSEVTSYRWPAGVPLPSSPGLPKTMAGAKSNVSEA